MPVCQPPSSNYLQPRYFTRSNTGDFERIDALLAGLPVNCRRLSSAGVEAFRTGQVTEASTCFEGIHRSFPLADIAQVEKPATPLKKALIESLSSYLSHSKNPVIALSGGVDSLLLACLLKDILGHPPRTATLVSNLPGYCEEEATLRIAKQLGLPPIEVFEVNEESFVANLPSVISACEVPLYNLHPVSKWLFAKALHSRGHRACITGDGADQIAAGKIAYDYLPLLAPLFNDHEIELRCPFLTPNVVASIDARGPDPDKRIIRELAMEYLPNDFLNQRKHPCFTPPMDLSRYTTTERIEPDTDREQTFRTTLSLLRQSHLNKEVTCVPSPG